MRVFVISSELWFFYGMITVTPVQKRLLCLSYLLKTYCTRTGRNNDDRVLSSELIVYARFQSIITSAEEGGYVFSSVCLSVCLSVCPSDYSQTCERIFDEIFWRVGHGSRTKWYNFGGVPDRASDLGVQSPKSGSSGSAEVCALWVHLVI